MGIYFIHDSSLLQLQMMIFIKKYFISSACVINLVKLILFSNIWSNELVIFTDEEARVLIAATLEVLRTLSNLKLTEREIALLNTIVLFQPGNNRYSLLPVAGW